MQPCGPETLEDAIRRIDAKMRLLGDFKIDLSRPGVLERMRARREEMRRQYAELEEMRKEADRWLPEMLERYRNGSDADRRQMRDLLLEHFGQPQVGFLPRLFQLGVLPAHLVAARPHPLEHPRARQIDLDIAEPSHLGVDPADRVLEGFGSAPLHGRRLSQRRGRGSKPHQ